MSSSQLPAPDLLSYTSAVSDVPLLGETIGANLSRTVARFPEREALVDVPSGRRWTYRELDADVDRVARGLLARGIAKGDRVGVWSPNCAEWVLVQYATARVGAILVTVNPAYRSHELAYVVNQSGMRMLVSAVAHKTSDYRGMVEGVRAQCPALEDVVLIGDRTWDDLVAAGAEVPLERARTADGPARRRRADQHPVHLGHNGIPQRGNVVAPQHLEQRVLRREPRELRRDTTGCACPCRSTTASAW